MAVTLALLRRGVAGATRFSEFTITGPASYTTGGEALSAADLTTITGEPAFNIANIQNFSSESSTTGTRAVLDRTNSKMMLFAAGAEASGNQSTTVVRARCTWGQVTG